MKPWLSISLLIAWGTYFALTFASTTESAHLSKLIGDNENGAYVFDAAGCASCHMVKGSEDRLSLAGGQSFETEFGIFYAPNVSTSPTYGIGDWGLEQFVAALRDGVSAEGQHYFPAFPYTDYAKMTDQDIVDLWTFWQTLPAVETANKTHEIFFHFQYGAILGFGNYSMLMYPIPHKRVRGEPTLLKRWGIAPNVIRRVTYLGDSIRISG